jgi:hypothetical protein
VWKTQPKLSGLKILNSIGKGQPIQIDTSWEQRVVELFANSLVVNNVATKEYVDEKISEVDVSNYYNKTDVDAFIENVEKKTPINLSLEIDENYKLIAKLATKEKTLTSNEIDLPLETLVQNVTYDDKTDEIVILLANGS